MEVIIFGGVILLEVGIGAAMGVYLSLWVTVPIALFFGYMLFISLHDRGGLIAWLLFALPLLSLIITTVAVRHKEIWMGVSSLLPHLLR